MGQQRQQASYLLRATQRPAIEQVVVTCRAAVGACEAGASSVSRPDTFYERGSAIGPEVSTCCAAGGARERGKLRQQASSLLRAWLRQTILPVVVMFRAAVRAYEKGPAASVGLTFLMSEAASSSRMCLRTAQPSARAKLASIDSRPLTSYERRCAGPPCRW